MFTSCDPADCDSGEVQAENACNPGLLAIRLDPMVPLPSAIRSAIAPVGVRQTFSRWKAGMEARCHSLELAPDLAEDIGSARWFRGVGTMLGLTLAAVSFWPDLSSVEAATPMAMGDSVRDEFRSQMIMPLALGGDSGRRMGQTMAVVPLAGTPERPVVKLTATLGRGDSFGQALLRAGVGSPDAAGLRIWSRQSCRSATSNPEHAST